MDIFTNRAKYGVFGDERDEDYYIVGHSPLRMVVAVSLYLASLLTIRIFMRNRAPFELATPIRLYNLTLVLINCYLVWMVIHELNYGLMFFQCFSVRHHKMAACALIGDIFLRTRVLEFLDTIFFALRKKDNQISFLHVFHHSYVPVMAYLNLIVDLHPLAIMFAFLNSIVHVVMYSYYFLATFKSLQPYLWWKKYLTQLQMLQFVTAIVVSIWTAATSGHCSFYPKATFCYNILTASIFLGLFIRFYVNSYTKQRKTEKSNR